MVIVAAMLGACSDGSSGPPATPAPTPTVATTVVPFAGGINGPVSPGSTEPASR